MASKLIPLEYGRASQPQQPVGANLDVKGLAFLWSAGDKGAEAVTGKLTSTDNTAAGVYTGGRSVQSSVNQVNLEWASEFIVTSDGVGTGDFTASVLANPSTGTEVEHLFAQKNDAGGAPYNQFFIGANCNAGGAAVVGSLAFFTYDGTASAVAAAGYIDGNWHLFTGVRRGGSLELWVDGALVSSGSLAVRPILKSGTPRYTAIGSRGNGTTESFKKSAAFAAGLNRAATTTELVQWARNPWQLFAPQDLDIWVPGGGSGAATGSFSPLTLIVPTGSASAGGAATGSLSAIALIVPTGSASAGGVATATLSPLALIVPTGSASAGAEAVGTISALTLTAPTGSAATSAPTAGNAVGALAPISLTTLAGSASGAATATGSLAAVTLTSPTVTAIGAALASGSFIGISLTPVVGAASGSGQATGQFLSVSLTAVTGSASGGAGASGLLRAITLTTLTGSANQVFNPFIFSVAAEDRTVMIGAEDRTVMIGAEDRTLWIS